MTDTKKVFIGADNLKEVAKRVGSQIVTGPAYISPRLFERIGVKVSTGIQFKAVDYLLVRKGGTARRKDVHATLNTQVGYLKERELFAKLSWDHLTANVDDFVETPFSSGAHGDFKLASAAVEAKLLTYAEQLSLNTFWGDVTKDESGDASDENAAMALFDGFNTLIAHDINDGFISEKNGNLVKCEAITRPTDKDDTSAFDNVLDWYHKLDKGLRKNPAGFVILVDILRASYIAAAYANRSNGAIKVNYINEDGDFTVPEMPRVTFVPTDEYGTGDRLTATIRGNFEYGVDTENDKTFCDVKVGTDADMREVQFQIQSIQGTRIMNPLKSAFAVSDGTLVSDEYLGDYTKEDLTIAFDDKGGKVTVDGVEYTKPVALDFNAIKKLEAKANTDYEFAGWSNGAATASISVVAKGAPIMLMAKFVKKQ